MEEDISRIRKLLNYESDTGKLFWNERSKNDFPNVRPRILKSWNSRWTNKEAFTSVGTHGYFVGAIFGKLYLAHRVIWALHYNTWPNLIIDHVDGNRLNNSIRNLRLVSYEDSSKNVSRRCDNTSGVMGVHKARNGKWFARIVENGKKVHLGTFDNFEDAVARRKEAEIEYGYHKNHGRVV